MIRDARGTWAALKDARREAGAEIPGSERILYDGV